MEYSIFEVMEHGPIVWSNKDDGAIITVNGSYLNLFWDNGNGTFRGHDECRQTHIPNYPQHECLRDGPKSDYLTLSQAELLAEDWWTDIMSEDDSE